MKIVVCIKQVPDTSEVELDPVTNTLIRTGIPVIINPDDRSGVEAALALRESEPGSTVTVVSMGPAQAKMALMEALAMGCDEAYLVSDRKFGGSDTLATSTILAAALHTIGYDLIITGRQAIDGDTAQVGPEIAEHLGVPHISYVEAVEREPDGALLVLRQFEDRYHRLRVRCPCLLTALKELAQPRYMTVAGVMDAQSKEIKLLDYEALKEALGDAAVGLKGSPTSVIDSYAKEQKAQGALLKGLTADEAVDAIMARLHEEHII